MENSLQIIVCLSQLPFHMLTLKALTLLLNQLSKHFKPNVSLDRSWKWIQLKELTTGECASVLGQRYLQLTEGLGTLQIRLSGEHTICYICKCCFVRTVESVLICLYKQLISKQEKVLVLCRHPKCYGKSLFKLTRKSKHVLYAKVYYFVLYFLFYFYELEWVLDQLYLLA